MTTKSNYLTNNANQYLVNLRHTICNSKEFKPLSKSEEDNLKVLYRDNKEKLKEIMVKRTMRLVFSIARKYSRNTIDYSEMVSRGMYGLMVAINRFDFDRDIKFITYARNWIFKYIIKEFYDKAIFNEQRNNIPLDKTIGDVDKTNYLDAFQDKLMDKYNINASSGVSDVISTKDKLEYQAKLSNLDNVMDEFRFNLDDNIDKMVFDNIRFGYKNKKYSLRHLIEQNGYIKQSDYLTALKRKSVVKENLRKYLTEKGYG